LVISFLNFGYDEHAGLFDFFEHEVVTRLGPHRLQHEPGHGDNFAVMIFVDPSYMHLRLHVNHVLPVGRHPLQVYSAFWIWLAPASRSQIQKPFSNRLYLSLYLA